MADEMHNILLHRSLLQLFQLVGDFFNRRLFRSMRPLSTPLDHRAALAGAAVPAMRYLSGRAS